MRTIARVGLALSLLAALVLVVAGCGGGSGKQAEADGKKDSKDRSEATRHDSWWCDEHGIPEDECIMCSEKLKKEARGNGDWCKHNRARSQCFACNPGAKETFAAKYRAKYPGKEPPPATEND